MKHIPEPPGHVADRTFARETAFCLTSPSLRWRVTRRVLGLVYYIAMLAIMAALAGMAMDREIPVELGRREVLTPQVRPGERLLIRAERRILRICQPDHRWSLVDGAGLHFGFDPEPSYNPVGAASDANGPVVPFSAAPGTGRFVSTLRWYCNPLQKALDWPVVIVQRPDYFEITVR